ncbi:hypothetical protein GDO81_022186 [Engystomops pustulosus]|uniref:Deoxyribonuclease-2-alpha n=1 Tax=Engystomops pustulosus TaxID=76066 RepID=A0AAV6ZDM9_ENGPU|nr:hypothetical protein GDO81_022186 [Engystomops pustulosus]KAG8544612.1 hypothetical protein GDO81_022186 [Engystomops pustulosus]KAG8544613.1 hypothetical protein GDO81_022186 [Engystomops pustulosus]
MSLPLLVTLVLPALCSAAISCYGDQGGPVDWFIVYKLPRQDHTPEGGMKYMYQDGNSGGWVRGASLMNSTDSAVGKTLSQLYRSSQSKDVAYVLYNDQVPNVATNAIRGHTKGIQLMYNTITPYDSSVPDPFASDLPDLKSAAMKKQITQPPWKRQVTLTSSGGKQFTSFAKHANFGDDLYSGWVSEVLKSDLCVQFWLNSRGILQSNCSQPYHTYTIQNISFGSTISYSSHIDHSKWCVTWSDSPGWACIGDMNRDNEEMQRGGGTLCSSDPVVWKSFKTLVSDYSKCN